MQVDHSGPAFPFPGVPTDGIDIPWLIQPYPGMSVGTWFAGQALAGGLSSNGGLRVCEIVAQAYLIADAMLAEHKRREEEPDASTDPN